MTLARGMNSLLFTAVTALALILTVGTPRQAHAEVSVNVNAGYAQTTAFVGQPVNYVMTIDSRIYDRSTDTTATMQFPSAATVSSVLAPGCTFTPGGIGTSTINFTLTLGQGTDCRITFNVVFAESGTFGTTDHFSTGRWVAAPYDEGLMYDSFTGDIVVAPAPTPAAPAVCAITPDLAVSPELINLAPGGTAVIELAMRNLCDDAPTPSGDLLHSMSDGITVIDHSAGMTNLGQRVAVQNFTLAPSETRRWYVTVTAADSLVAAPVHVTEYYTGGRVSSRIDGVFITPAPVVETAPVAVAAPAPAPIPAALPNTAGEQSALPLSVALLTLGVGITAFALSRRTAQR